MEDKAEEETGAISMVGGRTAENIGFLEAYFFGTEEDGRILL